METVLLFYFLFEMVPAKDMYFSVEKESDSRSTETRWEKSVVRA